MVRFGPSGNSDSFYEQGYKDSVQMPEWLFEKGLNAYEYSCTKGVKIKAEKASKIKEEADKYDIALSVHSPYYINLASEDLEQRDKNIRYIIDTMKIARIMGATRVVVHSGSCAKISRQAALGNAKSTLDIALDKADDLGLGDIHLCPETMGKMNQLGTLDEVMELCLINDRLIPTIDFGHLYARSHGELNDRRSFEDIFSIIENKLGFDRLKIFHSHFSKIEYSAGGEKRHLTFENERYGPTFEYIAELVYKKGLNPIFICESAGTMAEDSVIMKNIYENWVT